MQRQAGARTGTKCVGRQRPIARGKCSPSSPGPAFNRPGPGVSRVCRLVCRSVPKQPAVKAGKQAVTFLVGDIGGTNARLCVFQADLASKDKVQLFAKTYSTSDYATFHAVLRVFLKEPEVPDSISTACLAVAGPVSNNACLMTNLSWIIDGREIEELFGIKTRVLNDFEALGYGIPVLPESDLFNLNPGAVQDAKGPKAVLGPGTGLGEAQLMWDEARNAYKVYPSEGSHADFAPRGVLQRELLEYAEEVEGLAAVEIEHMACGSGLKRIYRFLCHKQGTPLEYDDPALISQNALVEDGTKCPTCSQAVDLFLNVIGAEAGHMALRNMATGGVYVAGGIAPRLISRIKEGDFYNAFTNRPASRFSKTIEKFPLYVVLNDKVGLLGTCEYAMAMAAQATK